MTFEIEIVIARYNEDLNWINKIIDKSIKITIYNKGLDNIKDISNKYNFTIIPLKNIGRESHTYLYHIIKNYDNLAEQTIFCQGDSIFHSPDFLKLINKYNKDFQDIQPLSAYYWPSKVLPYGSVPDEHILDLTKNEWLKDCRLHVQYLDNNFITQYPSYDYEQHYYKFIETVKETYKIDNILDFFVERFNIPNINLDELIPMCFAGLFSVKKHVILDKCVEYYSNILSFLIYDIKINNLDYGLLLEKAWLIIFNYKKYNKNYITLKIKDYLQENYNLNIKNNISKFKITTEFCRLNFDITFDKELDMVYSIFVSEKVCHIRNKKKGKIYINKLDTLYAKKIFKNKLLNFIIELKKDNIIFKVNGLDIINFKINKSKIVSILLYDISKRNLLKILS